MQAHNWLLARVAEWQTRRTQNPLFERTCGFDSHLGHVVAQVPRFGSIRISRGFEGRAISTLFVWLHFFLNGVWRNWETGCV